ncbi:MAG TPA: hypothetical protein VK950_07545 [Methylophilus sp.]|nr:hypothetical protein [Methylophilus sp.]
MALMVEEVGRGIGSWVTDGVRPGMGVRLTAGTFASGNLNNNLVVLSLTATHLTVMTMNNSALTAEGPIAAATLSIPGKSTHVPASSHTAFITHSKMV